MVPHYWHRDELVVPSWGHVQACQWEDRAVGMGFHREAGTPHFAWDDPALLDMGGCFCKSHLVEARSGVLIAREFTSEGHSLLQ